MKKILFYTDCFMFGGCEKSLFEIVSHKDFLKEFDYEIIYRHSELYLDGLKKYKPNFPVSKLTPVNLPDISSWLYGKNPGEKTASPVFGFFLELFLSCFCRLYLFTNLFCFILKWLFVVPILFI